VKKNIEATSRFRLLAAVLIINLFPLIAFRDDNGTVASRIARFDAKQPRNSTRQEESRREVAESFYKEEKEEKKKQAEKQREDGGTSEGQPWQSCFRLGE